MMPPPMKEPELRKGRAKIPEPYFAQTPRGLEPVLLAEMEGLGLAGLRPVDGGVWFEGTPEDCYRSNLWLRTATRVLKEFARFDCPDENALYRQAARLDWDRVMNVDQTLAVKVRLGVSGFTHTHFLAQRIKDAVADSFRAATGKRPSVDTRNPDILIHAHLHQGMAVLSLDSSGQPLFKRGWRQAKGPAPLKENLAAGLVLLTGWKGETPFYDLMTGAGTLPIEAAMIAGNRAPGLLREGFGFQGWPGYNEALWTRLKTEARSLARPIGVELFAQDLDPVQVEQAKSNAKAAGVEEAIRFSAGDFRQFTPQTPGGLLLVNPPYGERLERQPDIPGLYKELGDVLKQRCKGLQGWVFTLSGEPVKSIGLRPSKRVILYNGPLECRLLKFDLY